MKYFAIFLAVFFRTSIDLSFKMAVHKVNLSQMDRIGPHVLKVASRPFIWLGIFFAFLNVWVWCYALANFDLSYIYPFFSINYVIMIMLGKVIFKERLDRQKLIGVGFILCGALVLFFSQ